jgi:hypothetical protein
MASSPRHRSGCFRHLPVEIDEKTSTVICRYDLDGVAFAERITIGQAVDWSDPAVLEAARIVSLVAGASYFKAGAPPVVDLGEVPVRPGEIEFLRAYLEHGLGEFAHRNGLDLQVEVVGGRSAAPAPTSVPRADRPLVPFGGGIDSIVTVDDVLRLGDEVDPALFVLSRAGDRFAAIEDAAAIVGLPIRRAERALDPQILRSDELGFFNGHVPITGILSAIAVLVAVADGRDAVVMSNEWSASSGNVVVDGRTVNHQWSKSDEFEVAFRSLLATALPGGPEYFSLLRPWSELAIAERFAGLDRFHRTFRSCNRAFHQDPAQRLDHWCGRCDKCCFIDLVLSPYVSADALREVFRGAEPLEQPQLLPTFRTLLGFGEDLKPFECVGDVEECRTAAVLAGDRPDRLRNEVLMALREELGAGLLGARMAAAALTRPMGPSHVPDRYATARLVG